MKSRKIPFLSFVTSPERKVKINLAGCNFNCRGCFAIAKYELGREFSLEGLIELLLTSCQTIYGGMVNEVQITGGEPTISKHYLLSLLNRLKELKIKNVTISTNGYLLNEEYIKELLTIKLNYLIKLDVKAYTDELHKWYTSKSNANVLRAVSLLKEYNLNFYVRTILIPDIIDADEIEKIAKFISKIDRNIVYKLYQFDSKHSENKVSSRGPTKEEMEEAFCIAKKYLNNVEFYTTETAYRKDYKFIEIRADELLDRFKDIDEISKKIIENWDLPYYTMNEILESRNITF